MREVQLRMLIGLIGLLIFSRFSTFTALHFITEAAVFVFSLSLEGGPPCLDQKCCFVSKSLSFPDLKKKVEGSGLGFGESRGKLHCVDEHGDHKDTPEAS